MTLILGFCLRQLACALPPLGGSTQCKHKVKGHKEGLGSFVKEAGPLGGRWGVDKPRVALRPMNGIGQNQASSRGGHFGVRSSNFRGKVSPMFIKAPSPRCGIIDAGRRSGKNAATK